MDENWMNGLCQNIANQVVNKAINNHVNDLHDLQKVTEVLINANWKEWVQEAINTKLASCALTCAICQQKYFHWEGSKYFCAPCNTPEHQREILRVQFQNRRAQKEKLPGTLTLPQWIETLNYFKWSCAYCQGEYVSLEHYNPLPYGGTTQKNCFPSCRTCNGIKKDYPPEMFERFFPSVNIQRIKEYQAAI